jgi:mannose-1-phosphate guanylyltransferase
MSTRYVVIMAGGSGTRFWPKSRVHRPKQFLAIGGNVPLLRRTADRVIARIGASHLYVVTGEVHADHARAMLPDVPRENILVEPEGRNTAPCIAWASAVIARKDPDARIAVLAADHHIGDVDGFLSHLEVAFEAAKERIVLFGVVPTHAETGYGYIRRGEPIARALGREIFAVDRFVEKPDRATAEAYLAAGTYLWNSGMFVFPTDLMMQEIARLLPDVARGVAALTADPTQIGAIYPKLPSVSIDYGVMEKSDRIAVLPASFGWSDVGSWDAAMEIHASDENGNVVLGEAMLSGVHRSMVDAEGGRFVALVGVDDLIVVDTKDALLVIKRGESQNVKKIVEALKAHNDKKLL